MLTKSDLQAISQIVDEKLNYRLKKELGPIKRDIRQICRDLNTTISFFDESIIDHERRIAHLEKNIIPNLN